MIGIDKLKKSSQNTHKSIERKARKTMQRSTFGNSTNTDQAHRVQGKVLQTEGTWGKLETRLNAPVL